MDRPSAPPTQGVGDQDGRGQPHPGPAQTPKTLSSDVQNLTLTVTRPVNGNVEGLIVPYRRDRSTKKEVIQLPIERKGYSASGREVDVFVNTYRILKFPTRAIYQYEINVSHPMEGIEKDRRVIRRCWMCETRVNDLPDAIFDGVGTAWSFHDVESVSERIVYQGGKKNPQGSLGDVHGRTVVFTAKRRRKIDISVINAWLHNRRPLDDRVIEAINFLDHLLRDWPATQFTPHKRAMFFQDLHTHPDGEVTSDFYSSLFGGASVYRGVFQAIRPSVSGLLVNMDAAHGVFFSRISLLGIMRGMLQASDNNALSRKLQSSLDHNRNEQPSADFKLVNKKIGGLRVMPNYEGCPKKFKGFNIKGLLMGTAKQFLVDIKDKATGETENMTVQQYFHKKYNLELQWPNLPLVQMQNASVVYPLELLVVKGLQRWPFKLTEQQTADMIKYTAKRPADRLSHIAKCKKLLQHDVDPQLATYGMRIDSSMMKTEARLLPSPQIEFGNAKHNPVTNGRWDLRNKKFLRPNITPLKSWGVGYFAGQHNSVNSVQVTSFIDNFVKIYKRHGGVFATTRPLSMELKEDIGPGVARLYEMTKKTWNSEPQLLIFIVTSKDSFAYLRIKKSCDCRFGVASQVLQSRQIMANKEQYHSNVLMKVNAKLGGITSRVVPNSPSWGLRPSSIIIGADVTHAMLGVWTPSLAAMCVSNDRYGVSYMGGCQSNGDKEEIIRENNIDDILAPLLREWVSTIGRNQEYPKFIYYFRDGVSESEYKNVLEQEIPAIKRIAAKCFKLSEYTGKITAVIANKRHHLRAFPVSNDSKSSDKNGNPLPGTLIDRDITSPHGWDFLLYAHTALQGTARPVHYKVILDEIGHKPDQLENMIYEQSYQYVRSTTSVSIHPAIYYAHLITARARHHENVSSTAGPQHGNKVRFEREKVGPAERHMIQHPERKHLGDTSSQGTSVPLRSDASDTVSEKSDSKQKFTVAGMNPERLSITGKGPEGAMQEVAKRKPDLGLEGEGKAPGAKQSPLLLPMRGTENRLQYRMWWI